MAVVISDYIATLYVQYWIIILIGDMMGTKSYFFSIIGKHEGRQKGRERVGQ